MRKLRRWVALHPLERWAVVEAWLLLLFVAVGIRCFGLRRIERWLDALGSLSRKADPLPHAGSTHLRSWVAVAAANHLGSPRCLERSLVLWTMLHRRGVRVRLRIGVRREGAGLEAHAWLEQDGAPLPCEIAAARGYRSLEPVGAGR